MHHKITDRQVYSYLSQTIDHDEIIAKLIENSMYLSFASTFLLSEEERMLLENMRILNPNT